MIQRHHCIHCTYTSLYILCVHVTILYINITVYIAIARTHHCIYCTYTSLYFTYHCMLYTSCTLYIVCTHHCIHCTYTSLYIVHTHHCIYTSLYILYVHIPIYSVKSAHVWLETSQQSVSCCFFTKFFRNVLFVAKILPTRNYITF